MTVVTRIGDDGVAAMRAANRLFADVFGEEGYHGPPAGDDHLRKLLADDKFIALTAHVDGELAGALAAYELVKFEAERSEIPLTAQSRSPASIASLRPPAGLFPGQ